MTTSHAASTAHTRLNRLRADMAAVEKAQTQASDEIGRLKDPHLSDEGLRAKKEEMRAQLKADVSAELARLRSEMDSAARTVAAHLDSQRPRIGDDAASLMRSQMAWDRVRMQLEAGIRMTEIIATADTQTALAIREWAPSWLEAQLARVTPAPTMEDAMAGTPRPRPDVDALLRTVDDRLYELHPGEFQNAVSYARRAEQTIAGARPLLDQRQAAALGQGSVDSLSAAIASRVAEAEAGARYADPAETTETYEAQPEPAA